MLPPTSFIVAYTVVFFFSHQVPSMALSKRKFVEMPNPSYRYNNQKINFTIITLIFVEPLSDKASPFW